MSTEPHHHTQGLTIKILIAMFAGVILGIILKYFPEDSLMQTIFTQGILLAGGKIFIAVMKMLVVPIVFVSLVCGTTSLGDPKKLGRLGIKTLCLYVFTTCVAITLALTFASLFSVGAGSHLGSETSNYVAQSAPPLIDTIINMFPANPLAAMVEGNMLQVIVFSLLLGVAISLCGRPGRHVISMFNNLNHVLMTLIMIIMRVAPYGVFCLIAGLFAKMGFDLIISLIKYFAVMLFVLLLHGFCTNSVLLRFVAGLNPLIFFKKMYSAMLFAFSTSSSNVSIPIVLRTVEHRLGVKNSVASFVIPLGATINMDGTAIMQGVATVFIANAYNIDIGLVGYLTVILTATLASIGTAGVPGVGMITLVMILQQVGLPAEGIALIIGVDRLLDMTRTAVNITGDSTVACIVGKSENSFDESIYNDPSAGQDINISNAAREHSEVETS